MVVVLLQESLFVFCNCVYFNILKEEFNSKKNMKTNVVGTNVGT